MSMLADPHAAELMLESPAYSFCMPAFSTLYNALATQDRLEQMGAQRRRQKQAEHRQEVDRLLQHKRDLYEAARVCPMPTDRSHSAA